MDLNRKQALTIVGAITLVFGLVGLPPLLQHLYGVNAVHVALVVILVYAALSFYMKKEN